ncbi:hypothetical protein Rsub_02606 [Raphidocelis subcapitata]|uniref:2-oxoglutarate dehydrogenase, mitochondrial n=1 Tax=Raphidocelis subcapitata TaxID=307507 RepID=A0A2V0NTA7_9CHLO|nr:hypothetical protein Rsub_02606 [Raphidocelis subcapitata]|eukprot:GBF89902.1 hypothetical protein Rsub_02606 [Raphidocelis subcapitata]
MVLGGVYTGMLLKRGQGAGKRLLRGYHASKGVAAAEPEPVPLSKLKDSFNDATSVTYLEEMEKRYQDDPGSVDRTWASFFKSLESGVPGEAIAEAFDAFEKGESRVSPLAAAAISNQTIQESMRLVMMVRAYQVNGHFAASLDPLGLDQRPHNPELDPASYGFSEADMDREFFIGSWGGTSGFLSEDRPIRTLREILTRLREAYCGHIGYEYMHIPEREKCNWLRERIETPVEAVFSTKKKQHTLDRLAWSEMFETFCSNKFTAAKRFGLEGCETLIPGMKALIDRVTDLGVESIVMGMPHRGRLNVLANVVRKPMAQIFSEFSGKAQKGAENEYMGSGDVKYHLGTSYNRPTINGKMVHLSLMANPSHLEAVNTCVLGKTRAKQLLSNDDERGKHMGVLLHGDGAFSGQGIVFETLDMCGLPDYSTGGTIHLVVNNQVAFTTDPRKSRSSPYCTDVAKALNCPIFHVNADDVEAVVRTCELAAEWRQRWKTDVVVDLVCYRKYGHNEIDEPMFTQPLMYKKIRGHKNAHQRYVEQLLAEGSLDSAAGNVVRLSGQDVERGTFSHRHATIHDQETGEKYTSLCHVFPGQKPGQLTISNSSLSEFGVLGFELGFSMETPNSLTLWEAQFGDFANGAQAGGALVIFDQFLSSGEAKWLRQSGLVGPEHSSARLERFLQMSDENPYVHRQFRKPLIVMSPKNLLRHPKCKSDLDEFDDVPGDHGIVGVRFKRVIMDDRGLLPKSRAPRPPQETVVKRVVFCTGKVFYELHAERERLGVQDDIAIVRIEQLAPFPFDLVSRELYRYPGAEMVWCQEEPMNMGAYFHIQPRMESCLRAEGRPTTGRITYAGRPPSASTATGFGQVHAQEQARLVGEALDLSFKMQI